MGRSSTRCTPTASRCGPSRAIRRRRRSPPASTTIAGDLTRPAEWAGALDGVDGVFLLSGYDGMTDLLARARDAGVRRAVLLSGSTVEGDDLDNAVSRYHAQAEADVARLRPGLDAPAPEQLHDQRVGVGRADPRRRRRARTVPRGARRGDRSRRRRSGRGARLRRAATSAAARCASADPSRWRRATASDPGRSPRARPALRRRSRTPRPGAEMHATLPAAYAEAFLSFFASRHTR